AAFAATPVLAIPATLSTVAIAIFGIILVIGPPCQNLIGAQVSRSNIAGFVHVPSSSVIF
ncbi:MAG: hypothetical protein KGI65_10185, partial [Acidobacteriota bacterium]|nr:hypothetical protein [Acidobacteriota bacterium]MDE3094341.1 hypothetical protein [Acidobacteriota bacterium]